ncbi:MAG: prolipoprotein diacylglyceryl transferase [Clostridiales bacterium]|jgi:phosphatidylglycerol:prolipoprotein diacylglycerol transferase|nr:prolipoprotein diacylglyceryl transferase [Clostridiales bacterium]
MNAPEVVFPNLGIEIPRLPHEAFRVGSMAIYWYGVCIVLGVGIAALVATREAKRVGHKPDIYMDFLFYALIASLIGARAYYVIFSWDGYKDDPLRVFAFREGGLAIYGAVIASFITGVIYTRIKKLNFWSFGDVCAPSLILGQSIGRWGNFFNREVFGHYSESLFAMRYLVDQVSVIPPSVAEHLVEANGARYIQVQPAFLYESAWNLMIFVVMTLYKRHKKRDGELVLLYLFGYGAGRFFIEGVRTDQLMLFGTGIPVSQLFSALIVIGAAVMFIIRRRSEPAEAIEETE